MMNMLQDYLFEIIVGIFVAGFTWGFRSWASAIRESTESILEKLEAVTKEIHSHRLETATNSARTDERLKSLEDRYNSSSL